MLISQTTVIASLCVSNHHAVHCKYIQFHLKIYQQRNKRHTHTQCLLHDKHRYYRDKVPFVEKRQRSNSCVLLQ